MKDLSKKFKAKNKKILNKNNVKLWAKKNSLGIPIKYLWYKRR